MKPIAGTKVPRLSQSVATLPLAAQKSAYPRRTAQAQMQTSVPALFAEGVDVGIELALRWIEAELVQNEASPSVEKALSSIRRHARQCSFLQQSLHTSAPRRVRSRRTLPALRGVGQGKL